MALTLTDLHWSLDLYLFTTAFTRFRKLTPGTLIAILNPSIMPPRHSAIDTGRWALTLHSSDDTVLEVGTSKDLGWCTAVKRDGRPCAAWLDRRRTEVCEFHVDHGVERARRGRMEMQGMSAPYAPGGRVAGRHGFFGGGGSAGAGGWRRKGGSGKDDVGNNLLKEGRQYDRGAHAEYYIAPSFAQHGGGGSSTATLIDADEVEYLGRDGREERARRVRAEREREREVAKKLSAGGNGAGAEYLRSRTDSTSAAASGQNSSVSGAPRNGNGETERGTDAARAITIGKAGAAEVRISPLKRKSRAMEGEAREGAARKKTRFVTAKGIREAGRDSTGGTTVGARAAVEGSDEDDLVIV